MDGSELMVVIAVSVMSGALAVTSIARAWLTSRGGRGLSDRRLDALEGRLERIEQAIDTVAVEVERISEGQRFTSKLLAERSAERAESGTQTE